MGDKPVMITAFCLTFFGWGLFRYQGIIEVFVKTHDYYSLGYEVLCVAFFATLFALYIGMKHKDGYR